MLDSQEHSEQEQPTESYPSQHSSKGTPEAFRQQLELFDTAS